MARYAQERAGIDTSGVTLGTVPGTVPKVVRTVVLGATWGANPTAKSTASRVAVCEANSMATWKLSCRASGEVSAEGTWPASCRVSRGLICGPVRAVVRAETSSASCETRCEVPRKMGTVPRSRSSNSLRYSPHFRSQRPREFHEEGKRGQSLGVAQSPAK